ncbi:FtsX-like permease family protein [Paenibacillus sedimenti]|uniref:ABC transporter permease n=1 Tax=Paenibacillus sedimenti TaxID=2770274 RepID=A0A926KSB4_9BACL|nr:ABC transporter permease [Paenibacillus sedimenti]MBD0382413.1 ABC transporter permease [Paenibacillus sedimenti]
MTFRQFAYRNVVRNKRTYAAYFLSSAFSVMIFFVCALFIFNPHIQEGIIFAIAVQAMLAAEFIMYVFSFFFVLYSVGSFLKTRKREFGILLMHGMTTGQLNRMVFLENMLIGVGAIVAGIIAGLLTGKLFLMIGSSFLGISPLPFYLSWKALILTIGSFVLLFLLISLCTSVLVRTNRLIDLFQADQKPKSEPKASMFLSLAAAVLLIASYDLAATASSASVMIRMFPVIGMTIIGTYFFYTQLSIFMIRLLQKNRLLFWRKTNMLTISSLAYRIKDNARMFFMVTIVSTVAFCAVGAFASMNSLSKEFAADYPAAIGYVAKEGNPIEQRHLGEIKAELELKGVAYQVGDMPIKYADIASSTSRFKPEHLPLISFSDYKKSSLMAGFKFEERPLSGNEALVLLGSLRDKSAMGAREKATYTLKENGLVIQEIGFTQHVGMPDYLLADMDGSFGGFVVSDQVFNQVAAARTDHFTGFYVENFGLTEGMASRLTRDGVTRYDTDQPYAITVSGTLYTVQKSLFGTMLFAALLVGTVFFIAAGSFLYFRLYADLDYDRRQYATIAKVGLTEQELNRIVTRQVSLLFFVPVGFAIVHSIFAFMALQSLYYLSIAAEMGVVLISFFIAQVIYFFIIRYRYLRNLKKSLI